MIDLLMLMNPEFIPSSESKPFILLLLVAPPKTDVSRDAVHATSLPFTTVVRLGMELHDAPRWSLGILSIFRYNV